MKRRRFGALAAITWLYVLWSLVPVLIAVRISFNSGKSRSAFQSTVDALVLGRPGVGVAERRAPDGARSTR